MATMVQILNFAALPEIFLDLLRDGFSLKFGRSRRSARLTGSVRKSVSEAGAGGLSEARFVADKDAPHIQDGMVTTRMILHF